MYPKSDSACTFHTETADMNPPKKKAKPINDASTPGSASFKQTCMSLVNIQGLVTNNNNKSNFLYNQCCRNSKSNIVAITETWLSDKHDDSEILKTFKDYSINRSDRNPANTPPRGGCLILSSPDIVAVPNKTFSNGHCELVITDFPSENITIIVVYNPPPLKPPAPPELSLQKFSETISTIRSHLLTNTHEVILCGDFNFPKEIVEWIESEEGIFAHQAPGNSPHKQAFELLLQLVIEFNLSQHIAKPTRINNTLDLVFTSPNVMIDTKTPIPIAPVSDHNIVSSDIIFDQDEAPSNPQDEPVSEPTLNKFYYQRADRKALKEALEGTDWESLLRTVPEEDMAASLINKVIDISKAAKVPQRRGSPNSKPKPDETLSNLQTAKAALEKKLQSPKCRDRDASTINDQLQELNTTILAREKELKDEEEERITSRIKENSKAFYSYVNRNRNVKSKIGPLKCGVNTYTSDSKKMAEILNKQYESMFSYILDTYPTMYNQPIQVPALQDIEFTRDDLIAKMKKISPSSASGLDEFPAYLLKNYAEELSVPLLIIWRRSLDSGLMPEGTLKSIITPIYKNSGAKSDPANYRPVALTSQLTKLFERVLHSAIMDHLISHNLLNDSQHGFCPGRGTLSQLLYYYNSVLTELESNDQVDAIYLDFSKAFDKVDHQILLQKLEYHGISGKILTWIQTFLTNRFQAVRVNGMLSTFTKVTSGVPQGSVLGPLLFIIMMFDIDATLCHSYISSFADDTRLWKATSDSTSCKALQDDLDSTNDWAKRNNMSFNNKKFEHITYRRAPHDQPSSYTTSEGSLIQTKEHVRDLGVSMSNDLSFSHHIKNIVAKGRKMSGWILRTFSTRKKTVLITLFKALVIHTLEYCSPLWSPSDKHHIHLIERVQREFTKRIGEFNTYHDDLGYNVCYTKYQNRINNLNIFSLERRRDRYVLIYIFKILHNYVPNPGLVWDYNMRTNLRCEPFQPSANTPAWIRKLRTNSFFHRGCRTFNLLPRKLRELNIHNADKIKHIKAFKKELGSYLKTIPDLMDTNDNSLLYHMMNTRQ